MSGGGLSLPGLVMMAGGLVLSYSGLNDPVGGPVGVIKDILSGKTPTPGTQHVTSGLVDAAVSGAKAGANAVVSGYRGNVLTVAKSYLGVRYVWGGQSRNGVDCSGLVLVAYRDGAGVKLPHRAT